MKTGYRLRIRFPTVLMWVFSALIVIGAVFMFEMAFTHQREAQLPVELVRVSSGDTLCIEGDRNRRIYVLQDSSSGMVWIGIPGMNQMDR